MKAGGYHVTRAEIGASQSIMTDSLERDRER